MNINKVIRKLKLSEIIEMNDPLLDLINNILSFIPDLQTRSDAGTIYYHIGDIVYIEVDLFNDALWCKREGFWDEIAIQLDLHYADTQTLLTYILIKRLNLSNILAAPYYHKMKASTII